MKFKRIGVMCGSSDVCPKKYLEMAYDLGQLLAKNNYDVVYGGGAKGLMKNVADGALKNGGNVFGYMPEFMTKVEWQHPELTKLYITKDMAERKYRMMTEADATVFLPGGCGTMEEFFEWLSSKRLGMHTGPLIIFNYENYYDSLIELLKLMVEEKFHNKIHAQMWVECKTLDDFVETLNTAPDWSEDAIEYASSRLDK